MTLSCNGRSSAEPRNVEIRTVEYPILPGGRVSAPLQDSNLSGSDDFLGTNAQSAVDLREQLSALNNHLREREQEFTRRIEVVRQEAAEQGRRAAAGDQQVWLQRCERALMTALEQLTNARENYLARVEHEVVRLALAIAERILQREAQMDPLLLAGVVRVALGRLAESTAVRLRVPAPDHELWADMLRFMPGLQPRPEVMSDERLQTTDAVLEADIGSVDLSVRAQIGEIERGFFDAPNAEGLDRAEPMRP